MKTTFAKLVYCVSGSLLFTVAFGVYVWAFYSGGAARIFAALGMVLVATVAAFAWADLVLSEAKRKKQIEQINKQ